MNQLMPTNFETLGVASLLEQSPSLAKVCLVRHADKSQGISAYLTPHLDVELSVGSCPVDLTLLGIPADLPVTRIYIDFSPSDAAALVANGALPRPDASRPNVGGVEYVAPRDALEVAVAAAWRHVLDGLHIGRYDDLRCMDGFSSLAARTAELLSERLFITVSVNDLFHAYSVWHLARHIRFRLPSDVAVSRMLVGPEDGPVALCPTLERLWVAEQVHSEAGTYNIPVAWHIHGPFDATAMERALNVVVARHEALRTCFDDSPAGPVSFAASTTYLALVHSHIEEASDSAHQLHELVQYEARRPFDLRKELPIRAMLLHLPSSDHVLALTLHHLAADGWSVGLLVRELELAYASECESRPSSLPPVDSQYSDYAAWQHSLAQSKELDLHCEFWLRALAPPLPAVPLPASTRHPIGRRSSGASVPFDLGLDLTQALHSYAASAHRKIFDVLASAVFALLHRCDDKARSDLVLAYPTANRSRPEVSGVIGCFVNTLAVRAVVSSDENFTQLLHAVGSSVAEARAFEQLPLELALERSISAGEPLQVLLNLNSNDEPTLRLHGLDVRTLPRLSSGAPFSLAWIVSPRSGRCRLEYDEDRFDRTTAIRLTKFFCSLLSIVVSSHEVKIGSLPLLSNDGSNPKEKMGSCQLSSDAERMAHHRIADRSRSSPNAIAVIDTRGSLTYGELENRAERLARYLNMLGVGPEVFVGVCMAREADAIVALVAVLKAGGVYLPLDPSHPAERLAGILKDTAAPVLLTQRKLAPCLPELGDLKVVWGDEDVPLIASSTTPTTQSGQLAYCLFTSGSSGEPKGVLVQHSSIAQHVEACITAYNLRIEDQVLQFASFSFDTSIEQILVALCAGATAVLRGDVTWSADELIDTIDQYSISIADIPTAYWHILDSVHCARINAGTLRLLLVGGEAAHTSTVAEQQLTVRVLNAYGPTETTVTACLAEIGRGAPGLGHFLPIGHALPETRVYVLDEDLQAAQIGVPGEIYIAGCRLARGYHNQPRLTAQKFIPNPFGEPGSRMYRTGDMGRQLFDGSIEFVGRIDQQIKLRGFRIELGEIESVLRKHPQVREAVVVIGSYADGEGLLIAHVTHHASSEMKTELLVSHCRRLLPEHMIPSIWVFPEVMPLTSSGKVDRKALAAQPMPYKHTEVADIVASSDPALMQPLLEMIAQIIPGCLPQPDSELSALGAHSMQIVRLAARVRSEFGVHIGVRQIARLRTARSIWRYLQAQSNSRT